MAKPLVGVVIGSRADFNVMKRGLESFRAMGVPYVFEMASAFKTPERLVRFAMGAAGKGIEVIVCASGGSAQVASVLASYTTIPVIAVPVDATPLRGQDALYSLVQSPPGVPIAVVGINNGENAVLLATQILAVKYPRYRQVLQHLRLGSAQKLEATWKEMLGEYPDLCQPDKTAPDSLRVTAADNDTDPGDDVTPDPDSTNVVKTHAERIRPGATLNYRPAPKINAGSLVPTPEPQEPANQTEDPEFRTSEASTPATGNEFSPPPRLSDLTPLVVSAERRAGIPPELASLPTPIESPMDRALDVAESYVETKVFDLDPENPDEDVLAHAMLVLLEGGIVAFPTDTVYGLAADATNPEAVRRLYEVKGHEAARKSLSVLISSQEMLETLVREVPAAVESVLEKFWPGGLTVLFYKHPSVVPSVNESPSIAIRIPNDRTAMQVLNMVERPLVVINAALGSSPAAVDARQVIDRFDGKIDCVLNAGACRSAETSTVLSVLTEPFEILREGIVSARDIRKILGPRLKD